ncbi:hypothetical protein Tco_0515907, partial [Tanacetum coccineum]
MSYLFFGNNGLSLAHYFRQFGSGFRYWIPDRYSSNRCLTLWQKGWIQAKLNSLFHVGAGAGLDCLTEVVVVGFLGGACFVA